MLHIWSCRPGSMSCDVFWSRFTPGWPPGGEHTAVSFTSCCHISGLCTSSSVAFTCHAVSLCLIHCNTACQVRHTHLRFKQVCCTVLSASVRASSSQHLGRPQGSSLFPGPRTCQVSPLGSNVRATFDLFVELKQFM